MSASTRTAPDARHAPAGEPTSSWVPLLIVLAGTFVTFLDFFIVNVALPSMARDLQAGTATISLVVAGYGVSFAGAMILGGRLGDLYGRRRLFVVGLTLFGLASVACGLAPNAGVLISARIVQGAAGALLTPQVLAIIAVSYDGTRRERAYAGYGLAMGVAGVLGQLLGGLLIHADLFGSGWRAIFLINVPVALLVAPLAVRHLPQSFGARTRLDVVGALESTAVVVLVTLGLVEGQQHDWPAWVWAGFALAPLLAVAFVTRQRRLARRGGVPLIDLMLLRSRSFTVGSSVAMVFALVPSGFFLVLALYLQDGRGYGPLLSGVVFAAVGVGYFAAIVWAGALADRWGPQMLALGGAGTAGGCLALIGSLRFASGVALLPGLVLIGLGIGLVLVPLSGVALRELDPAHAGAAAGVLASAQQVGGAIGVAMSATVYLSGGTVRESFEVSLAVLAGLGVLSASTAQAFARSAGGGTRL